MTVSKAEMDLHDKQLKALGMNSNMNAQEDMEIVRIHLEMSKNFRKQYLMDNPKEQEILDIVKPKGQREITENNLFENVDYATWKNIYREITKIVHPDVGGSSESFDFIARCNVLMTQQNKLDKYNIKRDLTYKKMQDYVNKCFEDIE